MSKHQYIIRDEKGNFLTGSKTFSPEYPDARVFTSPREAVKVGKGLADSNDNCIYIVEDYGFDTESEYSKIFPSRIK